MRKEPTETERKLWYALRDRRLCKLKFRRQVPMGRYIADFICHDQKLIVEVDGSQHAESAYDEKRDAWFKVQGFEVLRVWNGDVLSNFKGVLETILDAASPSSDPVLADRPTFSHQGRRQKEPNND
jgi:very-short-patch-repair endonuclease